MGLRAFWGEIQAGRQLRELARFARRLGLPQGDYETAIEFLDHSEAGLCLDTILTQLHELEIPVSEDFLRLTQLIARGFSIDYSEVRYIEDNVSASRVAGDIRDEISAYVAAVGA